MISRMIASFGRTLLVSFRFTARLAGALVVFVVALLVPAPRKQSGERLDEPETSEFERAEARRRAYIMLVLDPTRDRRP